MLAASASASGTTLYVASGGSDSGNCQDPSSPCATIDYAASQPGTPTQPTTINVGPGSFTAAISVSALNPGLSAELTIQGSVSGSTNTTTLNGPGLGASRGALTLRNLIINGNGGNPIVAGYAGSITVVDSTITNSATAVSALPPTGANVTVTNSTLSANAVAVETDTNGSATITNSTLSGNSVAIDNNGGDFAITASTISNNGTGIEGPWVYQSSSVSGTIISDNVGGDCSNLGSSPPIIDDGYNIADDATCGLTSTASQQNVNPELGALSDNGGFSQTMEPALGSPALDRIPIGTTSLCPGADGNDQRGTSRPQGPECDIGAVEVQELPVTSLPITSPTTTFCDGTLPAGTVVGMAATKDDGGYWIANNRGLVVACGDAPTLGGLSSAPNHPVVGIAATPDGGGYYLVASDGGVFSFGDASFHGSTGAMALNKPIVGMTTTSDGNGYWLVASDGGIFSFGDASFHGSTGSIALNKPIVGMSASNGGSGYWLVASDGGIFSFNVPFLGSMGGTHLNKPIVGMTADTTSGGYWLVASDGGIFSFNAPFHGSTGAIALNRPIVGMESTSNGGAGYRFVASDGGIFDFGASQFYGSPVAP